MKIIFNNKNIDDEINGYTTLNVEGRDLFIDDISTISIPGMDGSIFLDRNFKSRKITIHFLVESTRSLEHREILKKLNQILNTENEVEFSFSDELDCFYRGKVIEVKNPAVDSRNGVGNFTILCLDPFKFGTIKNTVRTVKSNYKYNVKIDTITATVNSTVNKVILKNTRGTKIILNGTFNQGDTIEIDLKTVKVNNQIRMDLIDYVESDLTEFKLYDKDIVTVTGASNLSISYRERWI